MTFGHITKKMKKEIQNIHIETTELVSVYDFGSFFRCAEANDCDILLVIRNDSVDLGLLHAKLSKRFYCLGEDLSIQFDLTILTEREHDRTPLLEHHMLIPLTKNFVTCRSENQASDSSQKPESKINEIFPPDSQSHLNHPPCKRLSKGYPKSWGLK